MMASDPDGLEARQQAHTSYVRWCIGLGAAILAMITLVLLFIVVWVVLL